VLVASFLVLLNPHIPESLDTLRFGVVMTLVTVAIVDFVYTQGKHGERKELEGVLGSDAVGDFGKEGVLGAGFDVGGRLEGTYGTFDCIAC
jgi:hypothetical protein